MGEKPDGIPHIVWDLAQRRPGGPDGPRAAVRGAGGTGAFVRLTDNNRARYRNADFMPDGRKVLALSDATGETEFTLLPPTVSGIRAP